MKNEKFFNGANKKEAEEMKRKRRGWIFINYFQNDVRKNGKRNEIFHLRGFFVEKKWFFENMKIGEHYFQLMMSNIIWSGVWL